MYAVPANGINPDHTASKRNLLIWVSTTPIIRMIHATFSAIKKMSKFQPSPKNGRIYMMKMDNFI